MKDFFQAEIPLNLEDAVSDVTAEKMHANFPSQQPSIGQIWLNNKNEIIGCVAITTFPHKQVWINLKTKNKLSNFDGVIFMPNASDILMNMPGWGLTQIEGMNYRCFLKSDPEQKFEHHNQHEACAAAWLAEKAKSNIKSNL